MPHPRHLEDGGGAGARVFRGHPLARHRLGDVGRARDFYERGLEAATEIGLVEGQLWALWGVAVCDAQAGDARAAARLLGFERELEARLNAAREAQDDAVEQETLARLENALGPELLESELAAGAALSLEDAMDLALGRKGSTTTG